MPFNQIPSTNETLFQKKKKVTELKRVEIETRPSQTEYLNLLMNADTTKRQIRKTRYCLTYINQYFEIDIYPFWKDKAIAEIELSDENAKIESPKKLRLLKTLLMMKAIKMRRWQNIA